MKTKLENKVAVITGGNSGIGLATARLFAANGASVVIAGRDKTSLDSAVTSIGHNTISIVADVSKSADRTRLFNAVAEKFGKIDVLFVNAGIARFAPLEAVDEAFFDEQVAINFKGAFFTVHAARPHLNNGASVIFNATALVHKGLANSSVYTATKAALVSLAKTLSAELLGRGIRVNALSPGAISTPIYGKLGLPAEAVEKMASEIQNQVPMKRFGEAEEIAKAALFLASSDSSYFVGNELIVDGGLAQL
jgi:NAD(P)-dependent dehydrogenase (short-subunit alcohol dehydrogenase family)